MELKGTQTEKNLHTALAGESMARNKYTYYAMAARKDGQEAVADMIERLARNEMMHARLWFELLNGVPGDTRQNLMEAAQGEFAEWSSMYPDFAKKAREEGLETVAVMFDQVAAIERDHERQFMTILAELSGTQQKAEVGEPSKVQRQGYRCVFCGAVFDARPDTCEVCKAIGSFEICTLEG